MDFAIFFAPDFSYIFRPLQDESDSTSKDRTTEGSKLNIRDSSDLVFDRLFKLFHFLFHKTFENAIFFATSKKKESHLDGRQYSLRLLNSGPEDYPLECRPKDFIKPWLDTRGEIPRAR